MRVQCPTCLFFYDDAQRLSFCPHDKFISDEIAKQKDLACSLIGKDVSFAHIPEGKKYRVTGINGDGMVTITDLPGEFAPHLFAVRT